VGTIDISQGASRYRSGNVNLPRDLDSRFLVKRKSTQGLKVMTPQLRVRCMVEFLREESGRFLGDVQMKAEKRILIILSRQAT